MTRSTRPIRIEGPIAYVPLTQGKEAIIDAVDAHLLAGRDWFTVVNRGKVYAARKEHGRTLLLHRFLTRAEGGVEVDHRDGNGLNNRRANLRMAEKWQNNSNTVRRSDNVSGKKGVGWHKRIGKWRARINHRGKSHELGYFSTKEAAAVAYAKASAELHGEFGRLE